MIITKCEVLKINTNEIWSYDKVVVETQQLYLDFQNSNDPSSLGFVFERLWEPPINNDENNIFIENE